MLFVRSGRRLRAAHVTARTPRRSCIPAAAKLMHVGSISDLYFPELPYLFSHDFYTCQVYPSAKLLLGVDQTSLAKQRLPMKRADARDRYDLRASRKAAFRQPLPLLFLFLFSLPHK